MEEKFYKITGSELLDFIAAYAKLNALECYGVDNWNGYGDALHEFWEEYKRESPEVTKYCNGDWFSGRAIAKYELDNYDEI